jgi:hypothetical protein
MNITDKNEINEAFAKFEPDPAGAYATCRLLPGQYAQENQQEWAEHGTIAGEPATVYYIFENSEASDEDASSYPFDAAHVDRIEIAEKNADGDIENHKNLIAAVGVDYKQQSSKPDWYGSVDGAIYVSATSGSSPFNEWYAFRDRMSAIDFIRSTFHSQSFVDGFEFLDGEYYRTDDVEWASEDSDERRLKPGATPAGIDEMIQAESRF